MPKAMNQNMSADLKQIIGTTESNDIKVNVYSESFARKEVNQLTVCRMVRWPA